MKQLVFLFFALLLLFPSKGKAKRLIDLRADSSQINLSDKFDYIVDESKELKPEDLASSSLEQRWVQNHQNYFSFETIGARIWFRFFLSETSLERWFFQLHFPRLDEFIFFTPQPNGVYKATHMNLFTCESWDLI